MNSTIPHIALAARGADGLAIIGNTRHAMMGIRYADGEGGNEPSDNPPATDNKPPASENPPKANENDDETPPPINAKTGKPYTAKETQDYIASLRTESKTNREAREKAEKEAQEAKDQRDKVLAALGLKSDGTPADETPEQLAAKLSERDKAVEATARENLVLRIGTRPEISANVDKLLDSRAFTDKLASLKSDDRDGVEALVKEWIENDPSYKVTAAASSSGGSAHSGTPPTGTRKSMSEAVSAALKKK